MTVPLAWHAFNTCADSMPTALMLHGFMGSGSDWQPVADRVKNTLRCLCPDLPGHGQAMHRLSGANAPMHAVAEALIYELNARRIACCALAGYSMGGRLALYLAARHPERFSCLILASASPGIEDAAARAERKRQDEQRARQLEALTTQTSSAIDENGFAAFLRNWYAQPLFHTLPLKPTLFEGLVKRRQHNAPPALAASLRGLGTGAQPSLWKALPSIAMPVLLVTGAEDAKFKAIAEAMAKALPKARHLSLPGCSHSVHEECPETFAVELEAFIKAQRPDLS